MNFSEGERYGSAELKRIYLEQSVYTALQERLEYIFREFENIYISFSGGKDSGLLLNLLMDYKREHYPDRRIGLFHMDFEAQYTVTTEYVTRTFEKYARETEPYWICLPMAVRTALSSYEMYWYPWDDTKPECWVRPMPQNPYVVNIDRPFKYYRYRMNQEDLAKQFGRYYREKHHQGKTICLLGVRAEESINRYSGFLNKKHGFEGKCWISRLFKDVWCASPIYDWTLSDVWHANYCFGYDYNKIYDLYYMAGLRPFQMRVASPFNDYSKENLNLYRVIDPVIWTKLLGRVCGANFTAIYGKTRAMGYRGIRLPDGYDWKSYTKFLLDTLPENLRNNYVKKFNTSIRFWRYTGGGLSEETINELREKGYRIALNGYSNYTVKRKYRVRFLGKLPDNTDDIKSTKDIPSWKRMCYCILKNDHNCRHMGFGLSRTAQRRVNLLKEYYRGILNEE